MDQLRVASLPASIYRPAESLRRRLWTGGKRLMVPRCVGIQSQREKTVPNDSHQRAAEFHELAAHAHRVAAVHHGKEDHLTAHELSKQALDHAKRALEWSEKAHRESAQAAAKP